MDIDGVKNVTEGWILKGFGIGLAIGFIFEVFILRTSSKKIRWFVSILSILAMGLMGWLSYDVAICSFPNSDWKPTAWTAGITANTWWACKVISSGRLTQLAVAAIIPERYHKSLGVNDED